ncbi:MAG: hypothetical protein CMJ49_12245 [Planctomycetaceae bacterium]|nr:hypothetical protein [Planctomycetaceae bacterium]
MFDLNRDDPSISSADERWLLDVGASPAAKRTTAYCVLGAYAFVGTLWYGRELAGDPMATEDLESVLTYVSIAAMIVVLYVWRFRLRVDVQGVRYRHLLWWRYQPWEKPIVDKRTGLATGKTAPFRLSACIVLTSAEHWSRVMDIRSSQVPQPPLPEPADRSIITNGVRMLECDENGLTHHGPRQVVQHWSWDEIERIEMIISDYYEPRLRKIQVFSSSETIEFRYPEDRPRCAVKIATLRRYLPDESLVVTTMTDIASDANEARRRAQHELGELRRLIKAGRQLSWTFGVMSVVMSVLMLWLLLEDPPGRTRPAGDSLVYLASIFVVVCPALAVIYFKGIRRTDPRQGSYYRAYQQFKADA